MKHFWNGFIKQANASGSSYRRDLAVDDAIHSMQEDTYPEGSFKFFDETKPAVSKGGEDASDRSNAGAPPRWLGVDTYTLGYAEAGI